MSLQYETTRLGTETSNVLRPAVDVFLIRSAIICGTAFGATMLALIASTLVADRRGPLLSLPIGIGLGLFLSLACAAGCLAWWCETLGVAWHVADDALETYVHGRLKSRTYWDDVSDVRTGFATTYIRSRRPGQTVYLGPLRRADGERLRGAWLHWQRSHAGGREAQPTVARAL